MTTATAPTGAKKRDYWWTVLATDPLALPIARFLASRRSITPDGVTLLALVVGVAVGPVFALGTRLALVVGGLLFYLAFILDCVDGKLARALGTSSPRGEALDHLADAGRRASASFGLAVWLWRSPEHPEHSVWWAIVYALLAFFFIEISGAEKGEPGDGVLGRWSAALARRRLLPNPGMPDVQATVFIIGPITGFVVPALGVGIGLVTVAIMLTVWRRLRVPRKAAR